MAIVKHPPGSQEARYRTPAARGIAYGRSERGLAALAVADPNRFFDRPDEDLAVANSSGLGGGVQYFYNLFRALIRHDNFDLHFREEINCVLRPTIRLGMAFLTAVATHFGDRDALHANVEERFLYLVQLVRLDNCLNHFHMVSILDSFRIP